MKRAKISRKEFATALPDGSARLHCYTIGSMFASVPMVGRAAKDAMERKLKQEIEKMKKESTASDTKEDTVGKDKENHSTCSSEHETPQAYYGSERVGLSIF